MCPKAGHQRCGIGAQRAGHIPDSGVISREFVLSVLSERRERRVFAKCGVLIPSEHQFYRIQKDIDPFFELKVVELSVRVRSQ
jgi:hypothetical protein